MEDIKENYTNYCLIGEPCYECIFDMENDSLWILENEEEYLDLLDFLKEKKVPIYLSLNDYRISKNNFIPYNK